MFGLLFTPHQRKVLHKLFYFRNFEIGVIYLHQFHFTGDTTAYCIQNATVTVPLSDTELMPSMILMYTKIKKAYRKGHAIFRVRSVGDKTVMLLFTSFNSRG